MSTRSGPGGSTPDPLVSRGFPSLETGTLRGDLALLLDTVIADAAGNRYATVLAELLAASATNPDLRPELQSVADTVDTGIRAMLRGGQERGELDPHVDVPLLADAMVSLTLRRLLFRLRPIDHTLTADVEALVFGSPPGRR